MVGLSTITAVLVTLFISLILPVVLLIVYGVKNKKKGVWSAWFLGAAGFFVFQILIRLPILNVAALLPGYVEFAKNHYVWYCLILAFTAGLFEVAGRYIVARILKKKLTYERGIAAGLGHGGIEAMLIVGMTYVNNLIYIVMINTGSMDKLVEQMAAQGVDTGSFLAIKETLIHSGFLLYYLAGYERILTMVFHTALSLLVCYTVWKGKDLQGTLICLGLHTAADFVTPLLNGLSTEYLGNVISVNMAYLFVYAYLTAVAAGSVVLIRKIKKNWK